MTDEKLFTLCREAGIILDPWYTVTARFKEKKIALTIDSSVNAFCLAASDWQKNTSEAVKFIANQLYKDSQLNGRYSDNEDFRTRFGKVAKLFNEALDNDL